jgi:hypothetical protein
LALGLPLLLAPLPLALGVCLFFASASSSTIANVLCGWPSSENAA